MRKGLIAAFVIAATLAVTSAQEPIAIGIVRVDGMLLPIALIRGQRFEAPPPPPEQTTVNGLPVGPAPFGQRDWPLKDRMWTLADGGARVEIRTTGKVLVPMPYCADRYLWRTTLKRPPAPEGIAPIPKIGAAVSGAALEFPDNVTTLPDESSRRVAERIVTLFLAREKAALADKKDVVSATDKPVRITQLSRYATAATATYYFEARKPLRYAEGFVDNDAGLVTGWIVDSPSGLKDVEVTYKVNDDGYKQGDHAMVRGVVPYRGRALWLLEWHGWETEYFTLHDWPSGIVRVLADGYQCS